MIRKTLLLVLALACLPAIAPAADLTGTWKGDDGGTYYLRQAGNVLYWYGEERADKPRWANVFHGRIRKGRIKGYWTDVPKGKTRGAGNMELVIRESGNVLASVRKTGGFGGSRWMRAGGKPAMLKPIGPVKTGKRMYVGKPVGGSAKEDCVTFNPRNTHAQRVNGRWIVKDGATRLFDFGAERGEAERAVVVVRHYGITDTCYVGGPRASFTYLLRRGRAPVGALRGEDCTAFHPDRIEVKRVGGRWKIVEGRRQLFDFGGKRDEAERSAVIIRKHGFTRTCYVGRPDPGLTYLRR